MCRRGFKIHFTYRYATSCGGQDEGELCIMVLKESEQHLCDYHISISLFRCIDEFNATKIDRVWRGAAHGRQRGRLGDCFVIWKGSEE